MIISIETNKGYNSFCSHCAHKNANRELSYYQIKDKYKFKLGDKVVRVYVGLGQETLCISCAIETITNVLVELDHYNETLKELKKDGDS